LTHN